MKYVVIDTEGSGLFDFSKPADAEGQPRLAALAMIFLDSDLQVENEYHRLVKPDGWELGSEAASINKLTTERLEAEGVPVHEVLDAYTAAIESGCVVVAYNAQHDCKTMRAELRRAGMDDLFEKTPNICAMRATKDVMKVRKGYKLGDACAFFKITQDDAHTALGDARACVEVFRKLREQNACPEPAVHYAKEKIAKEATGEQS